MSRYDDDHDRRRGNSTRLYVGHLSSQTRSRDLEDIFSKYGRVRDVDMKRDFAFVDFSHSEDADEAIHKMNGRDVDGRRIVVELARGAPRGRGGQGSGCCFNCGRDGHWARDCTSGDWKDKCYRCHERGHVERNCTNRNPKWSRYSPARSHRSRSRSPVRSPVRRFMRSRSRSPVRSPVRRSMRSRSPVRSPVRRSVRSRSRSPVRRGRRSYSRSVSRSPHRKSPTPNDATPERDGSRSPSPMRPRSITLVRHGDRDRRSYSRSPSRSPSPSPRYRKRSPPYDDDESPSPKRGRLINSRSPSPRRGDDRSPRGSESP